MNLQTRTGKLLSILAVAMLSVTLVTPAIAKNTVSKGKGVKCYYVTTQTGPASYTHVQVCRKVGV
jgi:hypothetical protein